MSMKPTGRDCAAAGIGAVGGVALWEAVKWGWRKFRKPSEGSSSDSKKKAA